MLHLALLLSWRPRFQSLEAGQRRLRDALAELRAASLRWKRQAEAQSRSDRAALAWLRQRVVELQGQLDDVNRVLGEALERTLFERAATFSAFEL